MGAWDKFLRRTKGKAGGNTVDLEMTEELKDEEYVKNLKIFIIKQKACIWMKL